MQAATGKANHLMVYAVISGSIQLQDGATFRCQRFKPSLTWVIHAAAVPEAGQRWSCGMLSDESESSWSRLRRRERVIF
jgi:hypothetical protein